MEVECSGARMLWSQAALALFSDYQVWRLGFWEEDGLAAIDYWIDCLTPLRNESLSLSGILSISLLIISNSYGVSFLWCHLYYIIQMVL